MLAERREKGEREERRHRQPHRGGEEIPVTSRRAVGHAAPSQAAHPGQHGREAANVEEHREAEHADREGPDARAVAKGERSTRRAAGAQLPGDQAAGRGKD